MNQGENEKCCDYKPVSRKTQQVGARASLPARSRFCEKAIFLHFLSNKQILSTLRSNFRRASMPALQFIKTFHQEISEFF